MQEQWTKQTELSFERQGNSERVESSRLRKCSQRHDVRWIDLNDIFILSSFRWEQLEFHKLKPGGRE